MTLTPPGQALVQHARVVLQQLEHLRGDLQEYAKGVKGHLRMFANTTALGEQEICVRSLAALPGFARDLVVLLVADANGALVKAQGTAAS